MDLNCFILGETWCFIDIHGNGQDLQVKYLLIDSVITYIKAVRSLTFKTVIINM